MMPEKFDRPVNGYHRLFKSERSFVYRHTEMTDHYRLIMECVCFDLAQRVMQSAPLIDLAKALNVALDPTNH